MKRTSLVAAVAAIVVSMLPAPASARGATTTIQARDFEFAPVRVAVALGGAVRWHNDSNASLHTAKQDPPVRLFNTGDINPGDTSAPKTMWAAGRFSYVCRYHPFIMLGLVKVPVEASRRRIGLGEQVRIDLSSRATFGGYAFTLQRKRGRGDWKLVERGISTDSVVVRPRHTGKFRFRARLVERGVGPAGWSPAVRVLVGDV
jgi:plastocyanin